MWGTRRPSRSGRGSDRFIPTHVGNSPALPAFEDHHLVHPHACGELVVDDDYLALPCGSSPRMWGTLECVIEKIFPGRFIPTHVGNSSRSPRCLVQKPVHPHACGELFSLPLSCIGTGGSSPRMWGTQLADGAMTHGRRFIPTHVGNSIFGGRG